MRRVIDIQQGIPIEAAREIVKFIKDQKLKKVQASIQADQVRVSSPSKDELQEAMTHLRDHDFGVALQFGNYRLFFFFFFFGTGLGNALSSHLDMTAPISRLFFSNIIMWPLPWMPTSASLIQVGWTPACSRYLTVQWS